MSLHEYKRKRDFSKSPEPPGEPVPHRSGGAGGFFCVQKHLATQLHYDLRLEHGGVLLSWAIPKGPSIDSRDRRLAMHVEDHPVEYGTFEGIIPEGYGAGIVMLWDSGTWTPEVDDVDAALKKGDLKLTLDGYKLKGSWVLVRTGGRGPGNAPGREDRAWLLIKHRDEWSGPIDITTFAPLSIASGGEFEDILAAESPDIWSSNRPAKSGGSGKLPEEIIEKAAAIRASHAATTRATDGAGVGATPKTRTPARAKRTTTAKKAKKTSQTKNALKARPTRPKAPASGKTTKARTTKARAKKRPTARTT